MLRANAFSSQLRAGADFVWQRVFSHSFITELRDGLLPLEKFRYYVKEDYAFLLEFARCLGLATAKAEGLGTMQTLSSLLDSSLTTEVRMLEGLGQKLRISEQELHRSEPSPTTLAYTHHLLHVAYSGTLGEILSAMLPCMWSYQEIGDRIGNSSALRINRIYGEWCSTYTTEDYRELVQWYRNLLDRFAYGCGESVRSRMRTHYMLSSKYEYLFWDMAYAEEKWPI